MMPETKVRPSVTTTPIAPARRFTKRQVSQFLTWSSCVCTVLGGGLLASKTLLSPYGFLLLAMGSSQMVGATYLIRDRALFCYSVCVFLFVDCFGIYRWLVVGH
jgi:hypothetical protein